MPDSAALPGPAWWAGRPVCVTGGTGFLGWHLVQHLRNLGAAVRVLALDPPPDHPLRQLPDVACWWGDIRDPAVVAPAVQGCAVVFHAAAGVVAWGRARRDLCQVHLTGTRAVLAAVAPDTRVVHTSSLLAVGCSPRGDPVDETWAGPLPAMPYARAKRAAEELALGTPDRDVVVVNPAYLVGPEDEGPSVMGRLCDRFWRGRVVLALPGGLNVVDVRDVAMGHLLAAQRGRAGRRYLLGGANLTYRELLVALAAAAGYRPRLLPRLSLPACWVVALLAELRSAALGREPYPSFDAVRLSRDRWYCSSARAATELGYAPRPLDQALRETFAWHHARQHYRPRALNRWLLGA